MEDQCILISNGRVIDPQNGIEESRDIFIEQGRVQAVVNPGELKIDGSVTRIEAKGLLVMPGLIDMHVHLREPGYEWKETVASGARAAIAGGFTSICCMPNTNPANDCAEITDFIIRRAKAAGAARVFPVGAVTVGREGRKMAPLSELAKAGCVGFSDDGDPIFDAGLMRRALEWSRMVGLPIMCHEEEKTLAHGGCMNESALSMRLGLKGIPCVAEDVMVARDIELARVTGARVHFCHISSARSVELIRRAKNDGIPVSAEVAPHHLMLSEQAVASYDTNAKMNPPLRKEEDVLGVREGLRDGTIDAIASDHAPHEADTKEVEFAQASFGTIGLQTTMPLALALVRNGVFTLERVVEAMTVAPAKILGLEFGSLAVGAVADVTVVDPDVSWEFSPTEILSKSANSAFLGMTLQGAAETVIVGGKILKQEGRLVG